MWFYYLIVPESSHATLKPEVTDSAHQRNLTLVCFSACVIFINQIKFTSKFQIYSHWFVFCSFGVCGVCSAGLQG